MKQILKMFCLMTFLFKIQLITAQGGGGARAYPSGGVSVPIGPSYPSGNIPAKSYNSTGTSTGIGTGNTPAETYPGDPEYTGVKQQPAPATDYSIGSNNCTTTSNCTTTPAPAGFACTTGQTAMYVQVPNYSYPGGGNGTQSPGSSIKTCIDACNKGRTSDGKSITCKSFDFTNGQCTFYTSAPPAAGNATGLQSAQGITHVDQICVDSSQNCLGPSERYPNMILIGVVDVVIDAKDFVDCMQKCINAPTTFNIACKSGMFFYEDTANNCILNAGTKSSYPDWFKSSHPDWSGEKQDTVDYFEPNCGGATIDPSASSTSSSSSPTLDSDDKTFFKVSTFFKIGLSLLAYHASIFTSIFI